MITSTVRCPLCDRPMNEVTARANPGSLIVLDQCRQCGGIWCDKWELFPVQPDEGLRLDPLDEELFRTSVKLSKTLYCPRCTGQLSLFKEPLLPPEIQLQRCRRCEGIWLNRGQFGRYKRYQKNTRAKNLGEPLKLRRFEQAYQDPKSWVKTGVRGMFAYPRGAEESSVDLSELTLRGAFRLVLQTLLRLIFRF